MSDFNIEKVELYRQVRAVLVRHYIDLGRLSIQIVMQGARLRGTLLRLPGVQAPLTSEVINALIGELRQIRGLKRVDTELDNWTQGGGMGGWTPVEKRTMPRAQSQAAPGEQGRSYDLGGSKNPAPDG